MNKKNAVRKAAGVIFWLILWQIGAMLLNKSIILPTPVQSAARLMELMTERQFYATLLNSFIRIASGYFLGAAAGILLAVLARRFGTAEAVISPFMTAVKSVPVASFIILALFWMRSSLLSLFISFLIVMPIIYGSVYEGAGAADRKLKEAADIFGVKTADRIRFLYIPAVMPSLSGALKTAAGLAFKSGAAAEVIGRPDYTLGDMLYRAKIYLETADLFAWTAVIIVLSVAFEAFVSWGLKKAYSRLQKM